MRIVGLTLTTLALAVSFAACSDPAPTSPKPLSSIAPPHRAALGAETCAGATFELGALPYTVSDSTIGRTDDYNLSAEPSACAGGGSEYGSTGVGGDFAFVIVMDGTCDLSVQMDSVSGDMNVMVLTDCADLDGSCLGVDDAAGSGGIEEVQFTAVAGTTYYVIVDGYSGGEGDFDLTISELTSTGCGLTANCATSPDGTSCSDNNTCTDNDICTGGSCAGTTNDSLPCDDGSICTDDACSGGVCVGTPNAVGSCDDGNACTGIDACDAGTCFGPELSTPLCDLCRATLLTESTLPFNLSDDTTGGTDDFNIYSAGGCAGPGSEYSSTGIGADHLYRFMVDMDCSLDLALDPTASDNLHLYVVTDCGDLSASCLTIDDWGGSGSTENISITARIGVDYYLIIDGYNGAEGPYDLSITEASAVGCGLAPPGCDGTNDGLTCDDDNRCTETDVCTGGVCVGTANDGLNCEDGDPCTDNACTSGVCVTTNNTAACIDTDGNSCTTGLCTTGACVATNDDTAACDDGNSCTDDACISGSCVGTNNDNNFCTDNDPCTADACISGACNSIGRDCSNLNGACTAGFCNPTTGFCEAGPGNEGGSCDDGDACTESDICTAGTCAGSALDCSSLDDGICQVGLCNAGTGACEATTKDCSAADLPCNPAVCNAGTGICEPAPGNDGGTCDDADACTENDTCAAGSCAGTARSCDTVCQTATCEPGTGNCINATSQNEGGGCDDANPCTDTDVCTGGACVGTADDTLSCDDADACTADACVGGVCVGTALDCATLDGECSRGVCNATTGLCEADAIREGADCDDDDPCTKFDVCSTGTCSGAAKDCALFTDTCNAGMCNAVTGFCEATPVADATPCDDGDACTTNDACAAGTCTGTETCSLDDGGPPGGDDDGPGKTGGCGCSQRSPASAGLAVLLIGGLMSGQRRRRTRRKA